MTQDQAEKFVVGFEAAQIPTINICGRECYLVEDGVGVVDPRKESREFIDEVVRQGSRFYLS